MPTGGKDEVYTTSIGRTGGARYFCRWISTDDVEELYCRRAERRNGIGNSPNCSVDAGYIIVHDSALCYDYPRKERTPFVHIGVIVTHKRFISKAV